jgi:hypothetical protein
LEEICNKETQYSNQFKAALGKSSQWRMDLSNNIRLPLTAFQ